MTSRHNNDDIDNAYSSDEPADEQTTTVDGDGDNIAYDFLPDSATRDPFGYEQRDASWWGLGDHDEAADADWDEVEDALETLDDEIPGMEGLIGEANRIAEQYRDTGFECNVCGLRHGHSTEKHDVRDFFGVTEEFADQMNMNPYCHCGVNELARLLNFFRDIEIQVFEHEDEDDFDIDEVRAEVRSAARSAPIPEETRQQLNDTLGTI